LNDLNNALGIEPEDAIALIIILRTRGEVYLTINLTQYYTALNNLNNALYIESRNAIALRLILRSTTINLNSMIMH